MGAVSKLCTLALVAGSMGVNANGLQHEARDLSVSDQILANTPLDLLSKIPDDVIEGLPKDLKDKLSFDGKIPEEIKDKIPTGVKSKFAGRPGSTGTPSKYHGGKPGSTGTAHKGPFSESDSDETAPKYPIGKPESTGAPSELPISKPGPTGISSTGTVADYPVARAATTSSAASKSSDKSEHYKAAKPLSEEIVKGDKGTLRLKAYDWAQDVVLLDMYPFAVQSRLRSELIKLILLIPKTVSREEAEGKLLLLVDLVYAELPATDLIKQFERNADMFSKKTGVPPRPEVRRRAEAKEESCSCTSAVTVTVTLPPKAPATSAASSVVPPSSVNATGSVVPRPSNPPAQQNGTNGTAAYTGAAASVGGSGMMQTVGAMVVGSLVAAFLL
ncbi:unnamed protein product [Periconia digitata]|uniref:Uncharacterized protein n=1 Tax=Periconia digitata TaxID=1303443 RepID=A0A9W4UI84_9PLEO|nr:unnamed protein product [Periconia digitata]